MAVTRQFAWILCLLGFAPSAQSDWQLQRSDPSVRWSSVLKAPAPQNQPETGPLPPELPPVEPVPELETPPESVILDPPPRAPLTVLEEVWEPNWTQQAFEENSFLWRDSSDTAMVIPDGRNGFGLTSFSFESVWKNSSAPGVWIVPRFTWTFASGPNTPAVQAQLYDLRLEMNFAHPISDVWTVHLHAAPTFATDWNNKSSDAFRMVGGAMLAGHMDEHWTVLGGVVALSRFDLPILPLGGVRWRPNRRVEIDAVFPNPRFSWCHDVDTKKQESEWFYLGGQLGGNQWAIDHLHDQHDKLGYRDYRIVVGWETRKKDGESSLFEVGYVMHRRLEFQRGGPDQTPDDSVVFRWGSRF